MAKDLRPAVIGLVAVLFAGCGGGGASVTKPVATKPGDAKMRTAARPLARAVLAPLGMTEVRKAAKDALGLMDFSVKYPSGLADGQESSTGTLKDCRQVSTLEGDCTFNVKYGYLEDPKNTDFNNPGMVLSGQCTTEFDVVRVKHFSTLEHRFNLSSADANLGVLKGPKTVTLRSGALYSVEPPPTHGGDGVFLDAEAFMHRCQPYGRLHRSPNGQ